MAQLTNINNRIEFIDLAKGICIILVVSFHVFSFYKIEIPLNTQIQSFRMPLYFFLSGVFFKTYDSFKEFLRRKTNKLLVPFIFFYTFGSFVIPNLLGHIPGFDFYFIPITKLPSGFWQESFLFAAIWFLWCLYVQGILYYSIVQITQHFNHTKLHRLTLSFILGGIGITLGVKGINLPASFDSALSALPFYAMGHLVGKDTPILKASKFDKFIPVAIIICFCLITILAHDKIDFRKNIFVNYAWLTVYPCGIFGALGIIFLSKKIKKIPIVSYFGRYSIIILVTHELMYALFDHGICRFGYSPFRSAIINLALLIVAYLLVIPFMKKYMPHVTAQKDLF